MKGDQTPSIPKGWRLASYVGSGSSGSVYRIVSEDGERRAALKIISIPMDGQEIPRFRSQGLDNDAISRILEDRLVEIFDKYKILSKMNGESNIVSIEDVSYRRYQDGSGCDILVRMEDLTPLCETLDYKFSEKRAVAIGKDVLSALERFGQYRLVHAAVKPENVLVSTDGEYKLSDIGISGLLGAQAATLSGDGCDFMAPEVFMGKPFDGRADVYSAGLLLYWLCNDYRIPFLPDTDSLESEQFEEAVSRRMSGGAIPEPKYGSAKLRAVIAKACAYDPKDRYGSAAAMLFDLKRAIPAKAAVAATPIRIPEQPKERLYAEPIIRERRMPNPPIATPMPDQNEAISLFQEDFIEKRRTRTESPEPIGKKNTYAAGIIAAVAGLVLVAGASIAAILFVLSNRSSGSDGSGSTAQETIIPRTQTASTTTNVPDPVYPGEITPVPVATSDTAPSPYETPMPQETPQWTPEETPDVTPKPTPTPKPTATPLPTVEPGEGFAPRDIDDPVAWCLVVKGASLRLESNEDSEAISQIKYDKNKLYPVQLHHDYNNWTLIDYSSEYGESAWIYDGFLYNNWMLKNTDNMRFNHWLKTAYDSGVEMPFFGNETDGNGIPWVDKNTDVRLMKNRSDMTSIWKEPFIGLASENGVGEYKHIDDKNQNVFSLFVYDMQDAINNETVRWHFCMYYFTKSGTTYVYFGWIKDTELKQQ